MKKLIFLVVLMFIAGSCATKNKITSVSIDNAIIGQNEMFILKRLGMPSRVDHVREGGRY